MQAEKGTGGPGLLPIHRCGCVLWPHRSGREGVVVVAEGGGGVGVPALQEPCVRDV